jgi:hypothetical protein
VFGNHSKAGTSTLESYKNLWLILSFTNKSFSGEDNFKKTAFSVSKAGISEAYAF